MLQLILTAVAISNVSGLNPYCRSPSGRIKILPFEISEAIICNFPAGRSPNLDIFFFNKIRRIHCSSASPEYNPFFSNTRRGGPIYWVLKIRDLVRKEEKGICLMMSLMSSEVNPAASKEATIAPDDVPASLRKTTFACSADLTAPAREIPLTPPPSNTALIII
ncbi:hypothetical protein D3C76_1255570 [compost metagenome]